MATSGHQAPFELEVRVGTAANYALRAIQPTLLAAQTLINDIAAGALSTARLVVTFAGCLALLGGGVLMGSDDARAVLTARLSGTDAASSEAQGATPASDPDAEHRSLLANSNDPQQKRIVQYLVRRYRVADEAVRMLVASAFRIGKEKSLDPLLILSVVAVESSLNPFAQSPVGAKGLMQVMATVHAERFAPHGGETAALDPITNMKVGSSILQDLIVRGGSVERGLQLYVGAGNMPDDGGYGARVLGERARLQQAASGKIDAAIAAANRAAASASVPASSATAEALPVGAGTLDQLEPAPNSNSDTHVSRPEQSI